METPAEARPDRPESVNWRSPRGDLRGQGLRYLVAGGLNSLISLSTFWFLEREIGHVVGYAGAMVLTYAVGSVTGFALYRTFVFGPGASLVVDYLRFTSTIAGGFLLTLALLPVAVEVFGLEPFLGAVIVTGAITVLTFVGHRFFSFKNQA